MWFPNLYFWCQLYDLQTTAENFNLRYLTVVVGIFLFWVWFCVVGFCFVFSVAEGEWGIGCFFWKEVLRRKRGYTLIEERQRGGEVITDPDPSEQVLIFRRVIRAVVLLSTWSFAAI